MIDKNTQEKIEFSGIIRSVQPRSNVWRYRLDNRTHSMTGYNLFLSGTAEGEEGNFAVAISEKQMLKHRFHIGDEVRGTAWTKMYPKLEYVDYYRAGGLKKCPKARILTKKPGSHGLASCRNCRSMTGGDAACWTVVPGRESASPANGPAWQMWRSNTTGVSPRSSVLRASATVRKAANSIRWENPGRFLTKTADQFTMKDGSMRFAQKTAMMKSEECTLPQRMQIS